MRRVVAPAGSVLKAVECIVGAVLKIVHNDFHRVDLSLAFPLQRIAFEIDPHRLAALRERGHEVRLMPAQSVEAVCEDQQERLHRRYSYRRSRLPADDVLCPSQDR